MKRAIFIIGLLVAGCSTEQPTAAPEQEPMEAMSARPNNEPRYDPVAVANAEAAIRSERIVRGLVFDPSSSFSWNIAVMPDGSNRHGLAEYFCTVLTEHGARDEGTIVRILDATKANQYRDAYASYSLGSVRCSDTIWLD